MARRKHKTKRTIPPDYQYNSPVISKFINYIMRDGEKTVARRVVYGALAAVNEKTKQEALDIFDTALKNVSPQLELKTRRVGGANYQVPRPVSGDRKVTLAMRWIIQAAQKQKGRPMSARLADELIAASKNEGAAVKRREDTHRMAQANRAFAHFAR